MLAIKCHCPQETMLPILSKTMRNGRQFTFAHCVFCGKNITWMSVSNETILEDHDIQEVSENDISSEEMEWYRKKQK